MSVQICQVPDEIQAVPVQALTVRQAAKVAGMSYNRMTGLVKSGEVPARIRPCNRPHQPIIYLPDLMEWMNNWPKMRRVK